VEHDAVERPGVPGPFRRIADATVLTLMISPSARRSATMRGDPDTSSEAPWHETILASIRSRRNARSEGSRLSQV